MKRLFASALFLLPLAAHAQNAAQQIVWFTTAAPDNNGNPQCQRIDDMSGTTFVDGTTQAVVSTPQDELNLATKIDQEANQNPQYVLHFSIMADGSQEAVMVDQAGQDQEIKMFTNLQDCLAH